MIKVQKSGRDRESLVLISGITYAVVPSWYGVTCRNLKMDLIVPKRRAAGMPRPLLIWLCGGAFSVMNESIWIPELVDFARKGYIVASMEYRTMQEGAFPTPVVDIKAGIRYLKAHADQYQIDSQKIVLAGESAGATLAGLAALLKNAAYDVGDYLEEDSSVNAIIDFYGITDMNLIMQQNPSLSLAIEQQFLDRADQKLCREASLITHIDKTTPPFLIFHGEKDRAVPIEQSEILYAELERCNVRADFYRHEEAGHGDDCFYQKETLKIMDDFLREVLRT